MRHSTKEKVVRSKGNGCEGKVFCAMARARTTVCARWAIIVKDGLRTVSAQGTEGRNRHSTNADHREMLRMLRPRRRERKAKSKSKASHDDGHEGEAPHRHPEMSVNSGFWSGASSDDISGGGSALSAAKGSEASEARFSCGGSSGGQIVLRSPWLGTSGGNRAGCSGSCGDAPRRQSNAGEGLP